jgi:hypothetical protein
MRNVARKPDTLASRAEAGRWLSTLTRDSQIACQEVASALSQSERFAQFSTERHQAVLLVDKWAGPLQEELLGEYAYARSERASSLASTLHRIAQSFGRYYDGLIDSLRMLPHDRSHIRLSYVTLVRRLAHLRYESVVHALGHEPALEWRKVHRLYRLAMRQRARDASATSDEEAKAATLGASAETEYIQILFTHKLASHDLDPGEVLCAVGWLAEWAGSLTITDQPPSGNAFAIFPTGSEGLVAPPEMLSAGLLWLDLKPLHLQIRRESGREKATNEPDDGFGLSRDQRIALLDRLLSIWSGPQGSEARREPRREIRRTVQAAFGLADIAVAMRLSESFTKEWNAGEERRPLPVTPLERWRVADVSDSGCCVRGSTRAVASIPMGTLVAIRVDGNDTWIVGFVRRRGEMAGDEADLGIQILSTRIRLLALDDGAGVGAIVDSAHADSSAASASRGGTLPALLLSAGAGSRTSVRQTLLIRSEDYAVDRVYYCETKRHRYRLTLQQALERRGGCVWAALSVAKIGQIGAVKSRGTSTPGRDDTLSSF